MLRPLCRGRSEYWKSRWSSGMSQGWSMNSWDQFAKSWPGWTPSTVPASERERFGTCEECEDCSSWFPRALFCIPALPRAALSHLGVFPLTSNLTFTHCYLGQGDKWSWHHNVVGSQVMPSRFPQDLRGFPFFPAAKSTSRCCEPRHCMDSHEFKWTVKDGLIKCGP